MKRLLLGVAMLGVAALLWGCPIYGNENRVCQGGGCYSCPDPTYSGACINWTCSQDSDCGDGYYCDQGSGTCYPGSTYTPDAGPDSADDCSVTGCPSGYVCKLSNGAAQCVATGGSGDAGTGADSAAPGDAGSGGDVSTVDSGAPADASDGAVFGTACNADGDCAATGAGARCVDGLCAAQVNLCSDGTQCVSGGSACVDGLCEALCSGTQPCPSGYGCDFTRGVCNLNPGPCSGSGASSCQGGATCVEGHCVPPCDASAEGGPGCSAGQVCVNGGCIPDQGATFACANDGDQGQLSNTCPSTAICLHHDCYPACALDAVAPGCGAGMTCKDVTIETGIYAVCASAGTLGSDCDPAQGKACATGVCINGSCQ
ncbi:MAG TPA: hypothetical protein VHS09_03675 [Polyangiaceae bacterium]|nr:hypothetical protein [Polyangiaceae bacterium]